MKWVTKTTHVEWVVNGKYQWWELVYYYRSNTMKVDNVHAIEETWCPRNWIAA